MSPPTMAPGTEVSPPRMSTGSAFSAMSDRLNCTPLFAPHMMPATMPTIPATDQTMIQMVLSEIPRESAACGSSATALSARPMGVCWKISANAATSTAATRAAMRSNSLSSMPPTSTGEDGMPRSSALTFEPQAHSPTPSSRKLSPMVAMKSVIGG